MLATHFKHTFESYTDRTKPILSGILTEGILENSGYYTLTTYNSFFKKRPYDVFKAHCIELFRLRDNAELDSPLRNNLNLIIKDLQAKCPEHWTQLEAEPEHSYLSAASAA